MWHIGYASGIASSIARSSCTYSTKETKQFIRHTSFTFPIIDVYFSIDTTTTSTKFSQQQREDRPSSSLILAASTQLLRSSHKTTPTTLQLIDIIRGPSNDIDSGAFPVQGRGASIGTGNADDKRGRRRWPCIDSRTIRSAYTEPKSPNHHKSED